MKRWQVAKFGTNSDDVDYDQDAAVDDRGHLAKDPARTLNEDLNKVITPEMTYLASSVLSGIDHHWEKPHFATSGEKVALWDENRTTPIQEYHWGGSDQHYSVKWSPSETNLLLVTAGDNAIYLYGTAEPMTGTYLVPRCAAI